MMWSRQKRIRILAIIAGGIVFGIVMEAALDPIEQSNPGLTVLSLVLGMMALGAVVGYWYQREEKKFDALDEREQAIERRGSRLSHGTVTVGLATLALLLMLPLYDGAVWPLLWGLLGLSIAVHELSIEYYQRTM